jgi:hypothetical protein
MPATVTLFNLSKIQRERFASMNLPHAGCELRSANAPSATSGLRSKQSRGGRKMNRRVIQGCYDVMPLGSGPLNPIKNRSKRTGIRHALLAPLSQTSRKRDPISHYRGTRYTNHTYIAQKGPVAAVGYSSMQREMGGMF